jgi:transcriptional regulator with PAS, ATPase and Fis domain
LKVVEIWLPPLRERSGDIPLLIEYFLGKLNRKFDRRIKGLSTAVWKAFMDHPWPGNVRELRNTLEHAFVRCRDEVITRDHLPGDFHNPCGDFAGRETTSEAHEGEAIRWALQQTWGNRSKAAQLLGMSRRTIYRKMKKHAIAPASLPTIAEDSG